MLRVPVGVRVLEARHHVAGDQLVAAPRGVAVGPLVRGDQEGAEAAGLLLEPLDLRDQVVGRADATTKPVSIIASRHSSGVPVSGTPGSATTFWK